MNITFRKSDSMRFWWRKRVTKIPADWKFPTVRLKIATIQGFSTGITVPEPVSSQKESTVT
jgi:hypothetical protein